MFLVECVDQVGRNKVYINPHSVDFLAETPADQTIQMTMPDGTKVPVAIPKGCFNLQLTCGRCIIIDEEGGKKLINYVSPPVYALDAKTLFQYNTEEGVPHEEKQSSPPAAP